MNAKFNKTNDAKWFQVAEIYGLKKEYILHLYVSGATPHSVKAIRNITEICDKYLSKRFKLEIIDIYQKPLEAKKAQIIAVPTLIKSQPEPIRRLCGDMSKTAKVLNGLGIES